MFVIFGASGKAGGVTAAILRKAGQSVRAVVRNTRQAEPLAAIGCETVTADLTDPGSVRAAIEGAHTVQVLCPVPTGVPDPESAMRKMIDVAADALCAAPPAHVLAISDYGAQLEAGTGITLLFHYLETRLAPLAGRLTLLRSAEHMQNWARVIPVALQNGAFPSLHQPLSKVFPTVSAHDVGSIAAELLLDAAQRSNQPRIVSVEGPRRVTVLDVARALSDVAGKNVKAFELPRGEWATAMRAAGLTESHARLITELHDAHNAGKIDIEAGMTERRFGTTTLPEVIASLLSAHGHAQAV
ncbi:NmrA family NAD(P)-binding protein [Trinickia dinghuensis]|uniref:NmrA family transcriptional regulator n=1 Tax=Trinickia dinghuensis TaxID=2291023 RepID=A0A3D8K267_9BURK|nr:NmrA family NAD(P)-binding protein [Trinickia dinghuensis]RDU98996.1 NmrA family transcriptional regulator [Trinickia dinghuensis]